VTPSGSPAPTRGPADPNVPARPGEYWLPITFGLQLPVLLTAIVNAYFQSATVVKKDPATCRLVLDAGAVLLVLVEPDQPKRPVGRHPAEQVLNLGELVGVGTDGGFGQ
jgi:hypothetical protein